MNTMKTLKMQYALKRAIDILFALMVMILDLPLFLLIAAVIKLDSEGPVFYCHPRIGRWGKPFHLYKFRTMVAGGDDGTYMEYLRELIASSKEDPHGGKPYTKMKDDSRVTRVGRFLRTYYLDELPQMLNILKGELSLVGPRPHVQFEVDNYTSEQRRRLTVTPGATGLWQVKGKSDATFNELLEYDLEYIDNWNLLLDFQIMIMTVGIFLRGGEAFWTRTSKRIPGRRVVVSTSRMGSSQSAQFETPDTSNERSLQNNSRLPWSNYSYFRTRQSADKVPSNKD